MKRKIKIYLDTSVINFLFSEQSPEKREVTIEFFTNFVSTEIYDTYISDVVVAEIEETKNEEKKQALLDVITNFPIKYVDISKSTEIVDLANLYLDENIIPKKNEADAYHIAIAVVNNIDVLVSWNYKHLANYNRKKKIISVNILNNYFYPFDILTPPEVMDYENDTN
jgi:predicted nucleic acid-binding protein